MTDFIVDNALAGKTIKEYFEILQLSTTQVKRYKYDGKISVNDLPVTVRYVLQVGDRVHLESGARLQTPAFSDVGANILYADEYLYVAEKPYGVAIHPDRAHKDDTLGNRLATSFGNGFELRLITRLDKTTSGLVLGAMDEVTAQKLNEMQHQHQISKHYTALVQGTFDETCGRIDFPLLRDDNANKTLVNDKGKPSVTLFDVVWQKNEISLLHVLPQTGRTHQIRAHLAHTGHPIVGDVLYGAEAAPRIMLHCERLVFCHPQTGKRVDVRCPSEFDSN